MLIHMFMDYRSKRSYIHTHIDTHIHTACAHLKHVPGHMSKCMCIHMSTHKAPGLDLTLPCHAMRCVPYRAVPCRAVLCRAVPCCVHLTVPCRVVCTSPCRAHDVRCDATPCHVTCENISGLRAHKRFGGQLLCFTLVHIQPAAHACTNASASTHALGTHALGTHALGTRGCTVDVHHRMRTCADELAFDSWLRHISNYTNIYKN